MASTKWFDKLLYQAIYWYLVEQIAERLKSGDLRNASIYEFNPDAVYDPKQRRKKSCDQALRTNQALRTKHQEKLQTGIPIEASKQALAGRRKQRHLESCECNQALARTDA